MTRYAKLTVVTATSKPETDPSRGEAPGRRQIRLLNGPMRNASFELYGRTTIGREEASDILLLHNGVSRRHACVVRDADGNHTLIDEGSTNGTFVDNERVERQPLALGTTFTIAGCIMIYERVPAHQRVAPTRRRASASPPPLYAVPDTVPITPATPSVSREPKYDGDLIGDIARYRMIRTRRLRCEREAALDDRQFESLESRMRSAAGDNQLHDRRTYNRFSCSITCTVRTTEGDNIRGAVLDIGVDGARIAIADSRITLDSMVWVTLDRQHSGHVRTLVFSARVAWTGAISIGVAFAGTPGWSQRGRSKAPPPTARRLYAVAPQAPADEHFARA